MNLEKFTERARGFLQSAQTVAVRMNHQRIAPVQPPNPAAGKALADAGVKADALNAAINELRGGRTADTQSAEDRYDALKKFARDLTQAARDGKLDPVIGRDEEIRRTVQVLARRTKNNPVLIGEPGVGKTA